MEKIRIPLKEWLHDGFTMSRWNFHQNKIKNLNFNNLYKTYRLRGPFPNVEVDNKSFAKRLGKISKWSLSSNNNRLLIYKGGSNEVLESWGIQDVEVEVIKMKEPYITLHCQKQSKYLHRRIFYLNL